MLEVPRQNPHDRKPVTNKGTERKNTQEESTVKFQMPKTLSAAALLQQCSERSFQHIFNKLLFLLLTI